MATALTTISRLLPNGTDERTASFPATSICTFTATEADDGGVKVVNVATAPLGAHHLFTAPRQCGDWYCEIKGKRFVAAVGATREDACRAAVAKLDMAA